MGNLRKLEIPGLTEPLNVPQGYEINPWELNKRKCFFLTKKGVGLIGAIWDVISQLKVDEIINQSEERLRKKT